jgi:hypothetical protein
LASVVVTKIRLSVTDVVTKLSRTYVAERASSHTSCQMPQQVWLHHEPFG